MYRPTYNQCESVINVHEEQILILIDALRTHLAGDMQAVALAAPQLWPKGPLLTTDKRIFIVRPSADIGGIFINPRYISKSIAMKSEYEGCRSLQDHLPTLTRRHKWVKIQYLNAKGEELVEKYKGHAARIVQHEMDHLEGVMLSVRATR